MATTSNRSSGVVLAALALAMFVYVIDTTIIGVSLSNLVEDLDTEVGQIQLAISLYTLVMAAFMITGAKLGSIWGPRRAFRIGLIIYGVGTVTTALAPNIATLLIGWSILEGLGSALMVPAINTLVRSNFEGSSRAKAYGLIGGVSASGAALGPIVGGWLATEYSWRVAFWIEAGIVVLVLLVSVLIKSSATQKAFKDARLDVPGVALSVIGMGALVFGILQTKDLGFGSPVVLGLLVVGVALLALFAWRTFRQETRGGNPLIRLSILRHRSVNSGLPVILSQTFIQSGILFLVPMYAQLVLGFDALDTGLTILPLSIAVMVFSVGTSSLGHRIYPRTIIQVGLLALIVGGVLFAIAVPDIDSRGDFAIPLAIIGAGIGLMAGQLPNLILSGVDPDETSETAGLQGTSENLGMSLGTAVAGSLVVILLFSSFETNLANSTVVPESERDAVQALLERNTETLGVDIEERVAEQPPEVQEEFGRIFEVATDDSYQATVLIIGLIGLIGYLFSFRLPKIKLGEDKVTEAVRAATSMVPRLNLEGGDLEGPEAGPHGASGPSPPT